MRKFVRTCLVSALVIILSIDPAIAGRFANRRSRSQHVTCCPPPATYVVCPPTPCAPVNCGTVICGSDCQSSTITIVDEPCCTGESVVHHDATPEPTIVESVTSEAPEEGWSSAPLTPPPVGQVDYAEGSGTRTVEQEPSHSVLSTPQPGADQTSHDDNASTLEPLPLAAPVDPPESTIWTAPDEADDPAPVATDTVDELFAPTADDTAATGAADSDSAILDAPADEPVDAAASEPPADAGLFDSLDGDADVATSTDSGDDLFGSSEEEMPAAEESSDTSDLFGPTGGDDLIFDENTDVVPADDTSDDDLFGGSEDEMPASGDDSSDANDLFGPTDSGDAASADADLFSTETDEGDAAVDDLFGSADEPVEDASDNVAEPAAESADQENFVDDLFGPADDNAAADEPSDSEDADGEEEAEQADDDMDDLFGAQPQPSVLENPGGLASERLRRWVDNTGRYETQGRLVKLMDGKVRLLKDNGRTTTVPLGRLSAVDLDFVRQQIDAARDQLSMQTAQR